jgi:hypothetical protein
VAKTTTDVEAFAIREHKLTMMKRLMEELGELLNLQPQLERSWQARLLSQPRLYELFEDENENQRDEIMHGTFKINFEWVKHLWPMFLSYRLGLAQTPGETKVATMRGLMEPIAINRFTTATGYPVSPYEYAVGKTRTELLDALIAIASNRHPAQTLNQLRSFRNAATKTKGWLGQHRTEPSEYESAFLISTLLAYIRGVNNGTLSGVDHVVKIPGVLAAFELLDVLAFKPVGLLPVPTKR